MAKGRKGRKRKAAVALPSLPSMGSRKARRARAAMDNRFDLQAEIATLGPCPRRAVEAEVKARFGKQRIGAAFREAARYMPEVALVFLGARPLLNLRGCETVVRMLALEHPGFGAEVAARKEWLAKRDELLARDREMRRRREGMTMIDVDKDPKTGLPMARFGNDRGPSERARQEGGTFTTTAPNSDRRSQPVTVARASDTLGRLLRSQTINRAQHKVARKFEADFSLGQFDRYPTARLERTDGGDPDCGDGIVIARDRIHAALKLLGGSGSDMSNLMWNVVGGGMSLRDWVVHRRMSQPRRFTVPIATGLLSGALAILHGFYFPESKGSGAVADENPLLYRDAGRAGPDAPPFAARAAEFLAAAEKREREVVS